MEMKNVKELLMSAMTNYVIAAKAGDHNALTFYSGVVYTYFTVMGEFSRLSSPWYALWRKVFPQSFNYPLTYRHDGREDNI